MIVFYIKKIVPGLKRVAPVIGKCSFKIYKITNYIDFNVCLLVDG